MPEQNPQQIPPTAVPEPPATPSPAVAPPKAYDYPSFPRAFVSYRWFKPLLVGSLTFVFSIIFMLIMIFIYYAWVGSLDPLMAMADGYEGMDVTSGSGAFISIGSVAVFLPSLALALLIVQDRPWSSVSSSRGGWNWCLFAKTLPIAFAFAIVFVLGETLLFPDDSASHEITFTVGGFVMVTVLTPLQCVAEEYIFRGFLIQTFGSWIKKVPAISIILAALIFASQHPYNLEGQISIFLTGVVWGFGAWKTKGLETTSSIHIANNIVGFYLFGFGLQGMGSEIDIVGAILPVIMDAGYVATILVLGKKFGWFEAKEDAAAAFNAKKWPTYAHKIWMRQQKKQMAHAQQFQYSRYPQGPYPYQGYPQYPYPQSQVPSQMPVQYPPQPAMPQEYAPTYPAQTAYTPMYPQQAPTPTQPPVVYVPVPYPAQTYPQQPYPPRPAPPQQTQPPISE